MLSQSVRDLARLFERSRWHLLLAQNRCSKSSKAEKIMIRNKEDNLFFGKLVETKKQKLKRLKLESAGKFVKSAPSTTDSEYAWILSTSKNLNVISLSSKNNNDGVKVSVGKVSDEKVLDSPGKNVDVESQEETSKSKTEDNQSKDPLLPRVIVQQMLEFPVYEVAKTTNNQWDSNSKIMSLSAMENKACIKYPSVTKILAATMSEEAKKILENWKIKMIEKLGLRGFEIYQSELFEDGKLLHSTIMSHLTEQPYDVPNKIKQSFLSLNEVLKHVDQVRATESHVVHSRLLYRGIVDCIASYRGELCLIDWKKSDKPKNTIGDTYDAPLQLASYIGAVNSDPNYSFQIKKGFVIVAYTNGEPAKVHEINEDSLKMYWKLWLRRLQDYHISLNPS